MRTESDVETPYLVSRAGGKLVALSLSDVVEVMRPLPVWALEGAPPFVLGAASVVHLPAIVLQLEQRLGFPNRQR